MKYRINTDYLLMAFPALVAIASGGDLVADLKQGATSVHLFQEAVLLALALVIFIWLVWEYRSKKRQLNNLQMQLDEIRAMPQPDSPQLVLARQQLSEAIDEQFQQWQLTASEQEVGQMLLKGYSLKEIAMLRGTAEKTIRQQASSIYQKSGVSGRHAFAAWFLEDLL